MRSEKEILELMLGAAARDERIRVVMLNGSRVNPNVEKDEFQDYDAIYFVENFETFTADHHWIDVFGERVILQMPDAMRLPGEVEPKNVAFAYLMLFKDGSRIDLTLFPVEKIATHFKLDSLSVLLLDKDGIFGSIPPPDETDYLIKKPSKKEFADVCNEFWWLLPYVAKGLRRGEIIYAIDFLDGSVRKMFLKMIEWRVGAENDFAVNFGKSGRFIKRYANAQFYEGLLKTYPDAKPENIWKAMFLMAQIFDETARRCASAMQFIYNAEESEKVIKYLEKVKKGGN